MYYIYQFLDMNNKTIYVGKTTNLKQRFASHFSEEGWKQTEVKNIIYAKCLSQTDMDIYEIYYINKIKPKYNIALLTEDSPSFILPEISFEEYKEIDFSSISKNKYLLSYEDSAYDLSIIEQRIISLLLSKLNLDDNKIHLLKNISDNCIMIKMFTKEYINIYKARNNSIYRDLKSSIKNLNDKKIIIDNEIYNLVNLAYYDDDKSCIFIFFNLNVIEYLLKNIQKFSIIVNTFGEIKNKYTYQIYDLMLNFKNEDISIDNLRHRLNLNKKYPAYANLKDKIINPCLKEILCVLNVNVELQEIIENKKVVKVKIRVA